MIFKVIIISETYFGFSNMKSKMVHFKEMCIKSWFSVFFSLFLRGIVQGRRGEGEEEEDLDAFGMKSGLIGAGAAGDGGESPDQTLLMDKGDGLNLQLGDRGSDWDSGPGGHHHHSHGRF